MKRKLINNRFLSLIGLAALLNIGCAKITDFGNTNVNPNGSTYASTSTLLSAVEIRLGNNNYATNTGTTSPSAELLSGLMAQYFLSTLIRRPVCMQLPVSRSTQQVSIPVFSMMCKPSLTGTLILHWQWMQPTMAQTPAS